MTTVTATTEPTLELDDIQAGALYERPSPYVGTYLLLRIDDRADGRELVRRLHRIVNPARPRPTRADDTSITVAFTYPACEALGVPQASLDSFAPEFREGMAARAAILGDTGESSPEHWEKPLGTAEVHVAIAALSPDPAVLQAAAERARRAQEELPGVELIWRQDCYQLPTGRTSFGFKDGIGQPAVEGSGRPPSNPRERPLKAGEIILGYPDETGELPPMPTPDGPRSQRHLRGLPQAAHQGGRLPAVPARPGGDPRRGGPARREDGRALAERRTARARPGRATTPSSARIARRNNDFGYADDPRGLQVPGRRPRPSGQPARRLRPRRQRQRPAAPDDPARHQLRPDAARRRARGRRRRPGDHLRVRRGPPASGSSSSSRPSGSTTASSSAPRARRTPSSGRTTARAASPSRSARSAAGCRTCRRSSSPAAASTASRPACGRCAGWRT